MKYKLFGVILLAIVAMASLVGCSAAGPGKTDISTPAQQTGVLPATVNGSSQQGIWVSGQGIVSVTPDIATLDVGVSVRADKVADAQSQAAADMTKVISALTNNGVDQKDISTRYYTINPITKYDNTTQTSMITGYQVSNTVSVTVRKIENVGTIIDAVAAAGGDATRINSIKFSVDNPDQYYSQARTLAMSNAKAKATQLASLAGVTLGKPYYISESTPSTPQPYVVSAPAIAAPETSTPINPGQTKITLDIQVAYAIQ